MAAKTAPKNQTATQAAAAAAPAKAEPRTKAVEGGNPNIGITPAYTKRFNDLFNTRHYTSQTEMDLWGTVINAGLKAIEKRRKATVESKLDKAKATLAAHGITVNE